jgi:hypothetical protein
MAVLPSRDASNRCLPDDSRASRRANGPKRSFPPSTSGPLGPFDRVSDPLGPIDRASNPLGPIDRASNPLGPIDRASNPLGPIDRASNPLGPIDRASNPLGPIDQTCGPWGSLSCPQWPVSRERPFGPDRSGEQPFGPDRSGDLGLEFGRDREQPFGPDRSDNPLGPTIRRVDPALSCPQWLCSQDASSLLTGRQSRLPTCERSQKVIPAVNEWPFGPVRSGEQPFGPDRSGVWTLGIVELPPMAVPPSRDATNRCFPDASLAPPDVRTVPKGHSRRQRATLWDRSIG